MVGKLGKHFTLELIVVEADLDELMNMINILRAFWIIRVGS